MITLIIVFAIVIFLVIPSLKDRVLPVKKLVLMPIIFLYFLYSTITQSFALRTNSFMMITAGIILGVLLGIILRSRSKIGADREKSLIFLPKSYFGLTVFMLIFWAHFAIGYISSVAPSYLLQNNFGSNALLVLLSCVSSLSVGMHLCLYYKYHHTTETKSLERLNAKQR